MAAFSAWTQDHFQGLQGTLPQERVSLPRTAANLLNINQLFKIGVKKLLDAGREDDFFTKILTRNMSFGAIALPTLRDVFVIKPSDYNKVRHRNLGK